MSPQHISVIFEKPQNLIVLVDDIGNVDVESV